MKALDLDLAGSLQKQLRAEHVRAGEEARIDDGQTVVRLGGEVDDDLDLVLAEDVFDDVEIGDVGLDERNVGAFEIRPVSGVGQKVERDDAVVRVLPEPVVDEVRPDETGRAGDEDPHGVIVRGAPTSSFFPLLLAEPARLVDLLSVSLQLLRAIEVRQRLVAASELGKREPEVVLGVGLVGLAAALRERPRPARAIRSAPAQSPA